MKRHHKPTVRERLATAIAENYALQRKHLAVAQDTTRPRSERVASLHVIDAAQGNKPTPDAECDAVLAALAKEAP